MAPPSSPPAAGEGVEHGELRTADVRASLWTWVLLRSRFIVRRCVTIANTAHQINEDIRDPEVRLIGADGGQLGVMSAREAQSRADEAGLDLVKISPTAKPPVCKLMDYEKPAADEYA